MLRVSAPTKYRRKDDPDKIYTAVCYGNEGRTWDQECVARIAKFVLGIDTATRLTLENERIWDVVRPVESRWNPNNWLADIQVADWPRGTTFQLAIGDWLLKDELGILSFVKPLEFSQNFEPVLPVKVEATEIDELSKIVLSHIPWQDGVWKEAAQKIAEDIINSGWSKN